MIDRYTPDTRERNARNPNTSPGVGALHDAFVIKPVELEALLEQVGILLGLDWIRQPESASEPGTPAVQVGSPTGRSRRHLDDLYRLGRIGHVRGIEAKLHELELEDPVNEAFTTQLRTLIGNFDLKRYMHVLEALRAGN
jgi:hypothetical protein